MDAEDFDVAVIGAGVLGTFHAYFACKKGLKTVLIERGGLPGEASVRNFGILFPSGMTAGPWHRRAVESLAIYRDLARQVPFPLQEGGTQYIATTPVEAQVLHEFARLGPAQGYSCRLLDARQSAALNPAIDPDGCLASLHFPDDLRLEPRGLFRALLPWMVRTLGCEWLPRSVAVAVEPEDGGCVVCTSAREAVRARHVFVCSGADLRTLFPERFTGLVRCKLQMLRTSPQPGLRMPTALASGLTLRRYPSFRLAPSWALLASVPPEAELDRRGIHVLLVQDADGSVVVGDSHQYALAEDDDPDERLDAATDALILREARRLVRLPNWEVAQRWHGFYTLHPDRDPFTETLDDCIHLVTGIGGKGMTTGPAVARENIERIA